MRVGNLVFRIHANEAPPHTGELAAMLWAFVLVAIMSAAGFAVVWVVTAALIAASPS